MPASRVPSERAARAALAAHFTPEEVAADLADRSAAEVWQRRVSADPAGRLARYRPEEELRTATGGGQFVIPSDPEWPAALEDLGEQCPLGLWVIGREYLPRLTASAVDVIGNRNPTDHALTTTYVYAGALAAAGHTVTATLSYGVEATAHRTAAVSGQASLAVLPRGLDHCHPHAHGSLMRDIRDSWRYRCRWPHRNRSDLDPRKCSVPA
ncbi:DNA-processing protein DprA [Streptomyces minutiscleroticus]|uniref:DNA-processing protein DprA n=1 Tax=Streptomyces minutiscleroticus TaxID=68238 RepID=UPI00333031C8